MRLLARRALTAFAATAVALAASCTGRSAPIARVDWNTTSHASGVVRGGSLELSGPSSGGTFPLAVIEHPPVKGRNYALVGEVRYRGVQGRAFLEMWSVFGGRRYFSRTLATEGPMRALSGSSGWRPFRLPFSMGGSADGPDRLELDLVLPGSGTVDVGPLQLVAVTGGPAGAWWSDRTGGVIGGFGGVLLGVIGAAIGSLVSRRRARAFVIGAMTVAALLGVAVFGLGVVALAISQPYGVWFPLVLGGVIMAVVFGSALRTGRRAYADAELRRIRAMDGA